MQEALFQLFKQLNIPYKNHIHEPVFTVEDGLHLQKLIPGAHSKNLFLRNKKKSYYCLVSVIEEKRVDLKKLSDVLGHGRLSFGSAEDMKKLLNLTPGSVTPFGLINDKEQVIDFILDEDFLSHKEVNFHPMVNHMTVSLQTNDFISFFESHDIKPNILNIPV